MPAQTPPRLRGRPRSKKTKRGVSVTPRGKRRSATQKTSGEASGSNAKLEKLKKKREALYLRNTVPEPQVPSLSEDLASLPSPPHLPPPERGFMDRALDWWDGRVNIQDLNLPEPPQGPFGPPQAPEGHAEM